MHKFHRQSEKQEHGKHRSIPEHCLLYQKDIHSMDIVQVEHQEERQEKNWTWKWHNTRSWEQDKTVRHNIITYTPLNPNRSLVVYTFPVVHITFRPVWVKCKLKNLPTGLQERFSKNVLWSYRAVHRKDPRIVYRPIIRWRPNVKNNAYFNNKPVYLLPY